MVLKKIADSIEMSFSVPEADKEVANEALMRFEAVSNGLKFAIDHLDIMYEPFHNNSDVSTESVVKNRGILNRYKQKVKENFNKIKAQSLLAIKKLNYFSVGDDSIQELINSFTEGVDNVEDEVVKFFGVLDDYRSSDFISNILSTINSIKAQGEQLDNLIKDRIIEYVDKNILAKSWMNTLDDMDTTIEDRVPLVTELFKERQEALHPEMFPASSKNQQAFNPSDAQRVYYPDYTRKVNIGE